MTSYPNTYRELRQYLDDLNEDQLDKNITVEFNGEFFPAEFQDSPDYTDVLDEDHPVIVVI